MQWRHCHCDATVCLHTERQTERQNAVKTLVPTSAKFTALYSVGFIKNRKHHNVVSEIKPWNLAPFWRLLGAPLAPLFSRRPEAVPPFASRSYATENCCDDGSSCILSWCTFTSTSVALCFIAFWCACPTLAPHYEELLERRGLKQYC